MINNGHISGSVHMNCDHCYSCVKQRCGGIRDQHRMWGTYHFKDMEADERPVEALVSAVFSGAVVRGHWSALGVRFSHHVGGCHKRELYMVINLVILLGKRFIYGPSGCESLSSHTFKGFFICRFLFEGYITDKASIWRGTEECYWCWGLGGGMKPSKPKFGWAFVAVQCNG